MKFIIDTICEYTLVSLMFLFILFFLLITLLKTIKTLKKSDDKNRKDAVSDITKLSFAIVGTIAFMFFLSSSPREEYYSHWQGEVIKKDTYTEESDSRSHRTYTMYEIELDNEEYYTISSDEWDKIKVHDYIIKKSGSYHITIKK